MDMKPAVIDSFKAEAGLPDGRWVKMAPLEFFGPWRYIIRIYHAWLILRGKARAVTFLA